MISISRSLIRQFRSVARRAGLHKSSSIGTTCVRLVAMADALTLQASNGLVAIEYRTAGQFTPDDVTVPFHLFNDCEAKADQPVTICLDNSSRLIATWDDRGVPQQRDYDSLASTPEMPAIPSEWAENGPELLVALREAKGTAESSSTRYALDSLQLKGATGSIIATDSRQLLVQSGFQFPFREDLLVRTTNVFASSELPTGQPVEIGRTEHGVTVRVGSWTIYHEINKEGRFPNVERTIPEAGAITTRMQLDPADAKFFVDTVSRLPADDETDRPLTLDLNGTVAVRAQRDEQSPLTELILTRSRRIGNQLRLQTNREFLTRAMELGFTEIGFVDAQSPCVCRDATRTYVWMLLEPKGALEPNNNVQRIESSALSADTTNKVAKAARAEVLKKPTVLTNRVAEHLPQRSATSISRISQACLPESSRHSTDVIEQTLALRNQLRSIVLGLNDLVAQIRQQRKQTRLMKSTLQSLKQLQLLDA